MDDRTCPLAAAAERWPDREALISCEGALAFGELDRRVTASAAALVKLGVNEGDRVGIFAHNSRVCVIVVHALWRLGAVSCHISPRTPLEAVCQLLDRIDCRTLLVDEHRTLENPSPSINLIELGSIVSATKTKPSEKATLTTLDINRPATIMFTSGSSADPKAAVHTYASHYYNALGSNENIPLAPGDRWLVALPLWHVGGLGILFRTMLAGAASVIDDSGARAHVIEQQRITHLSLVSTQLRRLLDQKLSDEAAARLKAILVGGGAVDEGLIREGRDRGWPVCTTYGLTETTSQVTTSAPGDLNSPANCSGRLLPYRELRIAADSEILVRGRTLFEGYILGDDIDPARDDDGWFHTGDLGRMDDQDRLIVTGRRDRMFISGGENIQPEEIEQILNRHPKIVECVVVPASDNEFGHRPVAFVRVREGSRLSRDEIVASLAPSLPRFKHPVRFYRWPDDLREPSLKPRCVVFAELALTPDVDQLML